jgi:chromodomain-helicase-DNA-binding protein 1
MSTSLEDGPLNGHLSPDVEFDQDVSAEHDLNESDLSDSHREHANEASPTPSDSANHVPDHVTREGDMSDSDEPTPDNASDDAEFDMEESPPSQHDDVAETRSSSSESNQTSKRKAAVAEDDFMRANPELYGLRRSVSTQQKLTHKNS